MATTTSQMGSFYDEKRAASDLHKYRENVPAPTLRRRGLSCCRT
jgi:hypothetical protein